MKVVAFRITNNNYYFKNKDIILGQKERIPYTYDYIFSYNNEIITSKVSNVTYISDNLEFKPLSNKLLNKILSDNKIYIIILENGYPVPIKNKDDILYVFGLVYPLKSKITNTTYVSGRVDTEITLRLLGLPVNNRLTYSTDAYDFYTPYSDLNIYSINENNNKEISKGYVTMADIYDNPNSIKFKAEIVDISSYVNLPQTVDKVYFNNGNIIIRSKLDNYDSKQLNKFIDDLEYIFSDIANDFIVEYK